MNTTQATRELNIFQQSTVHIEYTEFTRGREVIMEVLKSSEFRSALFYMYGTKSYLTE